MEPEIERTYTSSERKAKVLAWTFIAICLIIYYLIMSMVAPSKKYEALRNEYGLTQNNTDQADENILTDSAYLSLLKEKAFLQARVTMAESDSIYLTISLPDSSINLEINGVTVHKALISKANICRMLKADDYTIFSVLAVPFTVDRNFATIKKEPLMIKMAPRDTSEFEPDIMPDTADYEPVNFIMEMTNGTKLCIYQEERLRPGDGLHLFVFDLWHRIRYAAKGFVRVMTFRVPDYQPYIKLRIPRSDAKIIYRALPEKGQIAVYS